MTIVATARTPLGGGEIIAAEWDFEGDGTYVAGKTGTPTEGRRARHGAHVQLNRARTS